MHGGCAYGLCAVGVGRGYAWQEAGMAGGLHGGRVWQERRQLQRAVRTILKCILVLLDIR